VVADHGNHGEKAKHVSKIVKGLIWNHRGYALNTNQRKDWALRRGSKEKNWPLSKNVVELQVYLSVVWFERARTGSLIRDHKLDFFTFLPYHTFAAMRPTIARQSDMPGRTFSENLWTMLTLELMKKNL
jgi:hypothetical protein